MILVSSHFGYPLSSTHVISGGVMGAGAAKRLSAVRWGVAGNIAAAWVVTLPAAGVFGAAAYGLASSFGSGALGPAADHAGRRRRAGDGVRDPPPAAGAGRERLTRPAAGAGRAARSRTGLAGSRGARVSRRSASTPGGSRA